MKRKIKIDPFVYSFFEFSEFQQTPQEEFGQNTVRNRIRNQFNYQPDLIVEEIEKEMELSFSNYKNHNNSHK